MILDALLDALIDSAKMLPILYITYLLMEMIEHHSSSKMVRTVTKLDKAGPLVGSLFGIIPQCGFSSAVASLYSAKGVTIGTLIAIFLSTSDEMLPILVSANADIALILQILGMKLVIGIVAGMMVDVVFAKRNRERKEDIHALCERAHCSCEDGVWLSAFRHTVNIILWIVAVCFLINLIFGIVGEDTLRELIGNRPVIGVFAAGILGLIPNCSTSVLLTNLYTEHVIGLGVMMAGLCVNAGVGLFVLYRQNRPLRDNLMITGILYVIGVAAGLIIGMFV